MELVPVPTRLREKRKTQERVLQNATSSCPQCRGAKFFIEFNLAKQRYVVLLWREDDIKRRSIARDVIHECPLCAKSGSRRNQISGIDSSARHPATRAGFQPNCETAGAIEPPSDVGSAMRHYGRCLSASPFEQIVDPKRQCLDVTIVDSDHVARNDGTANWHRIAFIA
jgi:hypothetical protein